jgi:hypothetical protein
MKQIVFASIFEPKAPAVDFYRNFGVWASVPGVMPMMLPRNADWSYALSAADILFVDRQFIGGCLQIVKAAKDRGIPVVIDLDDDLFNIDLYHPHLDQLTMPAVQQTIKEVLRTADHLIVTTPGLERLYSEYNASISVIPNVWNDHAHKMADISIRRKRKVAKMAYRGAKAHQRDIFEVHKTINNNLETFDWYFYGDIPISVDAKFNRIPWQPLHQYFIDLATLSPDFMFVPLANTKFNRDGKSNAAWIEAVVLGGSVVIAPDYLPEFDRPGVLRYSVGSEKNNLHKIFERAAKMTHEEKIEIVSAGQQYIKDNLRMSKWNEERRAVLDRLLTGKNNTNG